MSYARILFILLFLPVAALAMTPDAPLITAGTTGPAAAPPGKTVTVTPDKPALGAANQPASRQQANDKASGQLPPAKPWSDQR
jgi:hypothetical protein